MKKRLKLKVISIFIFTLFLIGFLCVNIYAETDTSYLFGNNITRFEDSTSKQMMLILGDDKKTESFMKGYFDSVKQDPEREKEFIKLWTEKKSDGTYKLPDEVKNKLWKYLIKSEKETANKYLKEIANKLFKQSYPDNMFSDPSKVGVKEVSINDAEKLEWKGNKLGVIGDNNKFASWLDLENMPRWITKIGFKDGKFDCMFNNGYGDKNIVFSGGTIGVYGELIGPDGRRIGTRMDENIRSITYDNEGKQFLVKYGVSGKDGQIEEKTLNLKEDLLPENVRNKLNEAISKDPSGLIQQTLGDLNGLGIDFLAGTSGGLPNQNMINVLYGGNSNLAEKIEISYDESGNPKLETSSGGTVVTMDALGKVKSTYKQWYSANGVSNNGRDSNGFISEYNKNHPDSQMTDENGVFLFSSNGEIVAGKNAMVEVSGFGTAFLSRDELIGVNVVHNTFVDAIARGDVKTVIDGVIKKGASLIDMEGLEAINLKDPGLRESLAPNIQKQLMDILRTELTNPDLTLETKAKIDEVMNAMTVSIAKSNENLIDYFMFGSKTDLTPQEQELRNSVVDGSSRQMQEAVSYLLNDPNKLRDLITINDDKARNEFIKEYLRGKVSSDVFNLGVDNSFVDSINQVLRKVDANTIDPDKLRTDATSAIDSLNINFQEMIKTAMQNKGSVDSKSALRDTLLGMLTPASTSTSPVAGGLFALTPTEREAVADSIVSLVSKAQDKVGEENKRLVTDFMNDISKNEYENKIVVDTYLGVVKATGSKRIAFDAKVPLNEFVGSNVKSASSIEGDVIELLSNGNSIVTFDSDKTIRSRIIAGGNYVSIDNIVNEQNSEKWKLGVDNSMPWLKTYTLYNPEKLVSASYTANGYLREKDGLWHRITGRGLGPGGAWQHPFIGSTVTKPMEGDIGAVEGSSVEIYDMTDQISGAFGLGALKQKFIIPKLPEGFPSGLIGKGAGELIDTKLPNGINLLGGQEALDSTLQQIDSYAAEARRLGVKLPLVIEDSFFVAKNPESIRTVFRFMEQQSTSPNQNNVIITPHYIEMNGQRLSTFTDKSGNSQDIGPALRTFMRGYEYTVSNPSINPFRSYSKRELDSLKSQQGGM